MNYPRKGEERSAWKNVLTRHFHISTKQTELKFGS
jgi:hypothetical protein